MQRQLALLLAALLATWVISLPSAGLAAFAGGFWPLRGTLILGSGYLAIGCMSLAMILAARPARLERLLGGLDQFYRLHSDGEHDNSGVGWLITGKSWATKGRNGKEK